MIIQHNIMAMSAYRNYMGNTNALSKNLEKLSSGYRINRAGDDAAGLAISEKMRAQITGLDAAQKNVQDGISLVQTAEGALQEVQDMLNRMVYLATQSANGTYDNEVDRANLQKEVDALSTEIDRIADSSNFNGIKLLDGSLGMNTEAISVANKGAVEASDGTIDLSAMFGEEAHLESATVAEVTDATFQLDLTGLTIAANGDTGTDKGTITLEFGGQTITLEDAIDPTKGVAENVVAALKADTDTKLDGTNVKIGNYAFGVSNTGDVITFTLAGDPNGTSAPTAFNTTTNVMTKDDAAAVNALMQGDIKVSYTPASGKASALSGELKTHDVTTVKQAVAKDGGGLAGIDLEITADMIKDGATLTIDGKDITFSYASDAADDFANGKISLKGYEEGSDEAIKAAVAKLSNVSAAYLAGKTDGAANGRTFEISRMDDKTIHIDQITNTTDTTKMLKTEEDIKGIISAKGAAVAAANATTTITLNADNLVEGNTITVDGKSFVFSKDPSSVEGGTGVDINNAVADLAAKLTEAGFNATADAEKGTVTLEAADAESSAPVVLGKGLALQIGDTADNFNQLAVSVEDMHVDALGIGDIDISTQEGASVAIDKIKAAINSVSMTRGTLGATQNRLEHTANNLSVMEENIQDAESSIRDTDIAEEMMAYTKNNILIQSAQAMLAQANTIPQGVLQLLG